MQTPQPVVSQPTKQDLHKKLEVLSEEDINEVEEKDTNRVERKESSNSIAYDTRELDGHTQY